ncbi:MAG: murein L,D-transpeptidase catalytic domain family protein [Chlorobiaceae bacterium]|jgi:L,D-transpeptidase catalytic domain
MRTKVLKIVPLVTLLLAFISGFSGFFLLKEKVSGQAYKAAFTAMDSYRSRHPEEHQRFLAVVDYSKPSYLKRMVVIDLKTGDQSFFWTAHGINSGELYANQFSNAPESNMSSLGLYKTLETYFGDHGKAIRLAGLNPLLNSNAFTRNIVLHSADYVSLKYILLNIATLNGPMIGRSNGCFVVSPRDIDEIEQKLNQGAFLYAWRETQ